MFIRNIFKRQIYSVILIASVLTIVFKMRTANAETFETAPSIADQTINVESVTGSAIEYSEEESHTDIKANSNKIAGAPDLYELMSAQTQGVHTHTADCYDGHKHIDVYGTNDISNVSVYLQSDYKFFEGSGWYHFVDFICGDCNQIIHSIRYTNTGTAQPYEGYTLSYDYNSSGVATTTKKAFNILAYTTQWNNIASHIQSLSVWASNNGSTSATERKSYKTSFSTFGTTLPVWDSTGNRIDIPFKGCSYEEGHPNSLACYPTGDMTKNVNVTFRNYSEPSLDYYIFTIKCATCNNNIIDVGSRSYMGGSFGGAGYSTSFRLTRTYFNTSGIRVTDYSAYSSSDVDAGASKSRQVFEYYLAYCLSLPGVYRTNPGSSTIYDYAANDVTWGMANLPYVLKDERSPNGYSYGTKPWLGCSYCGTFGSSYSCGQIQDNTTECNQVILSISPTYPIQTIYATNPIDKTAIATYLDGSTGTVNCTSTFNTSIIGTRIATLSYIGLIDNAKTNGTKTTTAQISVLAGLVSITPTVSNLVVYKGDNPVLTATATYMDTHTSLVTPTNDFNPNLIGSQNVTLSFTDQGITKTATCTIVVKPNLTSLSVSANNNSVLYNSNIVFTNTAYYEDGSSKTVSAVASNPYSKTQLGSQTVSYSYTENSRTKTSTVNVTVLDYPVNMSVTLQSNEIYQNCDAIISTHTVNLASGATKNDAALNRSDFDNIQIGPKTITYSYELNGVTVSCDMVITIKPDLYDITLDTNTLEIYKGQEPEINVTANFNISGEIPLTPEEFTITGFHNNIFDRTGTYYTLSYTSKGITISKQVFIRVLPNITSMTVSVPPQTTEGVQIPFSVIVQYEDGVNVTITDADIGGESESRLSIQDYDISQVGYQDITFQFSEGGRILTETVNIRVRALINISIPLNMLISIDPNISGPGGTISPDITLNNASKEPVIISVQSIVPIGGNELNDVLPTAHPDWTNLGKRQSKDIAIGLNCKNNWLINYLEAPLYIAQITSETDVGQIDKEAVGSIELLINHGNSHSEHREFTYSILWHIRLTE